jgi:hypothetical protein
MSVLNELNDNIFISDSFKNIKLITFILKIYNC